MSLIRSCIRACTVMALQGQTQAGNEVHDSRSDTIDAILKDGEQTPVIAVYTEEDFIKDGGRRHLNIIIEMTIVRAVEAQELDADDQPVFEEDGTTAKTEIALLKPHTDVETEFLLDLLEMEVRDALVAMEHKAANILHGLLIGKPVVESSQRASFDKDEPARFAARQLFMTCQTLKDGVAGQGIPPFVANAIALMAQDDQYRQIGELALKFANRAKGRDQHLIDLSRLRMPLETGKAIRIPGA